jgi:hypothetical protein
MLGYPAGHISKCMILACTRMLIKSDIGGYMGTLDARNGMRLTELLPACSHIVRMQMWPFGLCPA